MCYLALVSRIILLCFILCFFSVPNFSAQERILQVQIKGALPPSSQAIFEMFQDDKWSPVSTVTLNAEGMAQWSVTLKEPRQHRIRLSSDPKKYVEFVLEPADIFADTLRCFVTREYMLGQPVSLSKYSNQLAYVELIRAYNQLALNPDSLDRKGMPYQEREIEFRNTCLRIASEGDASFTRDVLANVLPVDWSEEETHKVEQWVAAGLADSLRIFFAKHMLQRITTFDESARNHLALLRRLHLFYPVYEELHQVPQFIDRAMLKAISDDAMAGYMFKFLLDKMMDHRQEEGLEYLLTWYAPDCAGDAEVADQTKNLIQALERCEPGKTIEFLTLPDLKGNLISSREVFAQHDVTLVMFWRGGCSHCREFEPILEKMYEKYQPLGLGVYAIGTDRTEEEWRNQATANNAPWPSVFLAFDQRKDFNKRFPVPSTPTLLAVNSDGVIMRRMILRSKIEEWIVELLAEAKQQH